MRGPSLISPRLTNLVAVICVGLFLTGDSLSVVGSAALDDRYPQLTAALDGAHPDVRQAIAVGGEPSRQLSRILDRMLDSAPPVDRLWNNQVANVTAEDEEAWKRGREIRLAGFDGWPVPRNPTWAEDPHRSASWQFRYHALGWLLPLTAIYQRERDSEVAAEARHIVLSWLAMHREGHVAGEFAWYDHAVAYRTDVLIYLASLGIFSDPSAHEASLLVGALAEHGRILRRFLDEQRFHGHNHNLFHALSLFNLATAFPQLHDAQEWRSRARERISELLAEMVDDDGVSTEQAVAYHYLALDLFAQADDYLRAHEAGFTRSERDILQAMVRFGGLIIQPSGSVPAIGDTAFGASAPRSLFERLAARGIVDQEANYVLSRGREGRRPPDAVFFAESGYSILRPSYGEQDDWEDDLHVVIDMGPPRRVHGHHDAMSFVMAGAGGPLIVDSGGPYRYGDPRHLEFISAYAHNTVIVDGQEYGDGSVDILRTIDEPAFSMVEGQHDLSPAALHRRIFLLLKPATLLVVDQLHGTSGDDHLFELLFHLPPDAHVSLVPGGFASSVPASGTLRGAITAMEPIEIEAIDDGRTAPLAFVTSRPGQRASAPVVQATQRGAEALFVTVLQAQPGIRTPSVVATVSDGAIEIEIADELSSWVLTLPPAGDSQPSVVSQRNR